MKTVRFLTNHPTPYRNHLFARISECARKRATIDFAVWYTTRADLSHAWRMTARDLAYPHKFLPARNERENASREQLSAAAHLINALTAERPDVLIVGGYFDLALQMACVLQRLHIVRGVLFCENRAPFRSDRVRRLLRTAFIKSFHDFIVPGPLQSGYLRSYFRQATEDIQFHEMPNLVDEDRFEREVIRRRGAAARLRAALGIAPGTTVFLSNTRLERVKGADVLVEAAGALPDDCLLLVAGEGSLRPQLSASEAVRSNRVRLLGWCDEGTILDLLALADYFVLPSRNDAFPLAAVEAIWAGLPVVLSDAVGCHSLVLVQHENGILVPSGSAAALQKALLEFASLSRDARTAMAACSLRLAAARFRTPVVVAGFLEYLEAL